MKRKRIPKRIPYINRCHSCGKETGLFMVSEWFWGLIKRVHCIKCVNKKMAKKVK